MATIVRDAPETGDGREQETERERQNRRMTELLQETRVAQMGIQILFAFLLGVPFTQRFSEVTSFQRDIYFATLLSAAVASALLIAPTAYHRLLFQKRERDYIIRSGHRLVLIGLAFVGAAMTAVVTLITDLLFDAGMTIGVTVAIFVVFAGVWYAVPLHRRHLHPDGPNGSARRNGGDEL